MPVERQQILTPSMVALFGCPIEWTSILGFDMQVDGLSALHAEWVRCVGSVSVTAVEAQVAGWLHDELIAPYISDDELRSATINMRTRRDGAVARYLKGVGRLAELAFLRPSHDGKHWSAAPEDARRRLARSQFLVDLEELTVATLFWDWFHDAFALADMSVIDAAHEPLSFVRGTEDLWNRLRRQPGVRVAVDVTEPVGFLGAEPLDHLVMDIHLDGRTVHAYPVSEAEARRVMAPWGGLRPIKSREYGSGL